jgi:hypothetical protein
MGKEAIHAHEIELIRAGRLGLPASAAELVLGRNAGEIWCA